MKDILFKILLITLCLFIGIATFASCNNSSNGDTNNGEENNTCQHEYGEWTLFSDGECQDRVYKHVCSKCQTLEWLSGSNADHQWKESTKEPTCDEKGVILSICEKCDKTEIQKELPLLEHSYEMSSDISDHWNQCTLCSHLESKEPHTLDSNFKCTVCSYQSHEYAYLIGDYTISITVFSDQKNVFEAQIKEFQEKYPGINLDVTLSVADHNDIPTELINASASNVPDIFCFRQFGTAPLKKAGHLSAPEAEIAEQIRTSNDTASVLAATVDGTIYAYPFSVDNGCFLFYDPEIITNPNDLAQIIADCEAAGKDFCIDLPNAWYAAAFFMATGCRSEWELNQNCKFIGVNDTYFSDEGLIALKAMKMILDSECYNRNIKDYENVAAMIGGTWLHPELQTTDLPSFTIDGATYHLSSFSGHKLMGVKPQSDSKKEELLHLLAQYLTNEECQRERNDSPSNLEVQKSMYDGYHGGLLLQVQYAIPEFSIHNSWWDLLAATIQNLDDANTDEELLRILEEYDKRLAEIEDSLITNRNYGPFSFSTVSSEGVVVYYRFYTISNTVFETPRLTLSKGSIIVSSGSGWNLENNEVIIPQDGVYKLQIIATGEKFGSIKLIPV